MPRMNSPMLRLDQDMREKKIERIYVAVVEGIVAQDQRDDRSADRQGPPSSEAAAGSARTGDMP